MSGPSGSKCINHLFRGRWNSLAISASLPKGPRRKILLDFGGPEGLREPMAD
jgi:hypothetical protein